MGGSLFLGLTALGLLATQGVAFQYSLTSGGNGYVSHFTGACGSKGCASGSIRAYQDCDIKADPQHCPVSGVGTFEQVRPGCFHNRIVWTMKDGRLLNGETFKAPDGSLCSPG